MYCLMFGNSDVGVWWYDWDILGISIVDEDYFIWGISNLVSFIMGLFYWGLLKRWICIGLVLKFVLKIINKVLYLCGVFYYVVILSCWDGWDLMRFKVVNIIIFIVVSEFYI